MAYWCVHSTELDFMRVSERPVQDSSTGCDCSTVESDEFRRSGEVSWPNCKETEQI